ncbi:GNAT family N-acetyltransferase [Ureibacillus manganicus]|uniref:GCN5 family acetyltransferase n=1 Tax=Ureibacillus manganicus DSM 26584 TaxID=1384049 RepID=A0A0A3I8H0_9BACL|nr:GNAT family N-acetyltransferase [Ureibacillus manganicus]KGR79053.1 GCN5 family acetyltransferase [Ureibacillus manganicus DSM 26584]
MEFIPINLTKHKECVIAFRKDSFIVSFGTDKDFGDENTYVDWLQQQSVKYPKGFVLLVENEIPIGQLELTVKEYEGKEIGYVNLYYLVPNKRGMGLGSLLHEYAIKYFKDNNVTEYHLRVSPTNKHAIAFYKKNGMKQIKTEFNGKVLRMAGTI